MDLDTFCQSSVFLSDRLSMSTSMMNIEEVFDLSLNKVHGVYKCTEEKILFEISDKNHIARAQLLFLNPILIYKVIMIPFEEFSLSYYCSINIYHENIQSIVKIPALRTYNPTGVLEFLSYQQFWFLLKITSAAIKAVVSGTSEKELSYLKNSIKNLPSYMNNNVMIDYMFVQVKTACFRKIIPPTYPEYVIAQIMKGAYFPREDTKEYLEVYLMFIKGETQEIQVPSEFYMSVLKNDKKISWEIKDKFSEKLSKSSKIGRMLKHLPWFVESFEYVEIGCKYEDLYSEIRKNGVDFEQSVGKLYECLLM